MTTVSLSPAALGGSAIDVEVDATADRLVVTGFDDAQNVVGFASCELTPSRRSCPVEVLVDPAHRGRGIGAELLRRLVVEARAHDVVSMRWSTPADDLAARGVLRAAQVISARRVDHGRAQTTIFVPEET